MPDFAFYACHGFLSGHPAAVLAGRFAFLTGFVAEQSSKFVDALDLQTEIVLGVGGAIVMQSDAEDEYEEILLKGRAPMQAIDPRVDPQTVFEQSP